jgi:choline dehydrogenase-like flavoprotein
VEYERHGEKHTVYARREILLSAGAVGSPKILMLSGIGPKRHLDEFGVSFVSKFDEISTEKKGILSFKLCTFHAKNQIRATLAIN